MTEAINRMLPEYFRIAVRIHRFCRYLTVAFAAGATLICGYAAGQISDNQEIGGFEAPAKVEVKPVADEAISRRLQSILESTEWYERPEVSVEDGVVFISGRALRREYREWAERLAARTEGVVAVVNRLRVERFLWDFSPALEELGHFWRGTVKSLPLILFALIILALFWLAARVVAAISRRLLTRRQVKPLLREVAAKAIAIPVFLIGLYVVLRISGLTRLAVTILGGTGIAGLIIGIAFRDIMENFLASILISMRNPFRSGDLIEIGGHIGVVQRVTTRGTVLIDFDGNHVQIPNATVYKNTIVNYTANPKRRMEFAVGIGYEDSIQEAQETALQVIASHPAVLDDPEPLILVESLGASAVNLKALFWFDGTRYNGFKIRSSLMRLVKQAFSVKSISMPDEAREVIFPREVPVRLMREAEPEPAGKPGPEKLPSESVATAAEGDFSSEEDQIKEQGRRSRIPEEGEDLL
jgi:small conductance mechanosensitive channel